LSEKHRVSNEWHVSYKSKGGKIVSSPNCFIKIDNHLWQMLLLNIV